MLVKKNKFLGFLGLLGLLAFRFINSGDINDLAYIGYFGFFAYFVTAKISGSRADERYRQDALRAKAFMGDLALTETAAVLILGIAVPVIREYLPVLVAVCFASMIIAYAVRLYRLEEK